MGFFENYARRLGRTENMLAYAESGSVSSGSFSGTPKKATVTLSQAQPNANYSVSVNGISDQRAWTIDSRTTTSFVINANADQALTGNVLWMLGGNL